MKQKVLLPLACMLAGFFLFSYTYSEKDGDENKNSKKNVKTSIAGKEPVLREANTDWFSTIQKEMQKKEYHINYQEKSKAFSSPNRANNFRVFFYPEKLKIIPREGNDSWQVEYTIAGIYKGDKKAMTVNKNSASSICKVENSNIRWEYRDFSVEYINEEKGIRQNFYVNEKPKGEGNLIVKLSVTGLTPVLKNEDEIALMDVHSAEDEKAVKIIYKDLYVTDISGKEIEAEMQVERNNMLLVINDANAKYPLFIDPLSTNANWSQESNQTNGKMGISSSAGDIK